MECCRNGEISGDGFPSVLQQLLSLSASPRDRASILDQCALHLLNLSFSSQERKFLERACSMICKAVEFLCCAFQPWDQEIGPEYLKFFQLLSMFAPADPQTYLAAVSALRCMDPTGLQEGVEGIFREADPDLLELRQFCAEFEGKRHLAEVGSAQ